MSRRTESTAFNPWAGSEQTLTDKFDKPVRALQPLEPAVVQCLNKGLNEMLPELPEAAREQILTYLSKLIRWNKSYNLTAVRNPMDMVSHHLLDSLSVLSAVNRIRGAYSGSHLLDVGAGAGLPGIALAIASPGLCLTLIESNGKKAAFMRQVGFDLGLQHIEVRQERAEQVKPPSLLNGPVDIIICRAFRSLVEFLDLTAHLITERTVILAMKGPAVTDELTELERAMADDDRSARLGPVVNSRSLVVETLQVPGLDATRTLVVLEPRADHSIQQSTIQE